jgi:hypothetical protein
MGNQAAQDPHPDKIVIMNSVSGWFAVHITWANELGGFYEPYQSGVGKYATKDDPELIKEATSWAQSESIAFEREVSNG